MELGTDFSQLKTVLEILDRYGVTTVVLLFVLYIVYVKHKQQRHNTTAHNVRELPNVLRYEMEINEILEDLFRSIDPAWITVWQFHNGTFSLAGVPFMKVSATHERARGGLYLFAKDFRDLPVSLFLTSVSGCQYKEHSGVVEIDQSDECVSPSILGAMRQMQIVQVFAVPIRKTDGSLIGLLTLSNTERQELNSESFDRIVVGATRISMVLTEMAKTIKGYS